MIKIIYFRKGGKNNDKDSDKMYHTSWICGISNHKNNGLEIFKK